MNIIEMHNRLTKHLFPAFSSEDEHFLALALCGEAGELANNIKKRWRDGVDLSEKVRDEIADIRVYLELIAKCFGIEGEKLDARVQKKLERVALGRMAGATRVPRPGERVVELGNVYDLGIVMKVVGTECEVRWNFYRGGVEMTEHTVYMPAELTWDSHRDVWTVPRGFMAGAS